MTYKQQRNRRKRKLLLCTWSVCILTAGICIGRISANAGSGCVTEITENMEGKTHNLSNLFQKNQQTMTAKNIADVPMILQNPELPTGCEVTALAMVLQYYGYDVDKCTLADVYLPKGEIGETDFHDTFVGNPRETYSYGCYAPAIMTTAKAFLEDQNASKNDRLYVYDMTGTEFEDLYDYLNQDFPVIVWGTMQNQEPYYTTEWVVDGKKITWLAKEHCMVLCGYDKNAGQVIVHDPLAGTERYDAELFEKRYEQMGSQAIVISGEALEYENK